MPPQFFLATFNNCKGLYAPVALCFGVPLQLFLANFNDGRSGEAVRPPTGAIVDACWLSQIVNLFLCNSIFEKYCLILFSEVLLDSIFGNIA